MLADLVPGTVVTAEVFGDTDGAVQFPEESAVVAGAVAKRQREFATGRACGHRVLRGLGLAPSPLLPDQRGAPVWPAGVVGSLTHCDSYRAAAAAWRDDVLAIGIDAEPNAPLPAGVLDAIALDSEWALVDRLTATNSGPCWDRLLFSTKEAVYKAWYPLERSWLGFADARITLDPAQRTFVADLLVDGPVASFAGRWTIGNGLLVTAIAVPNGAGPG
jgi:4'-phosphopantetheinyl transferase EntD